MSWSIRSYLRDLQPTYKGVIIHLLKYHGHPSIQGLHWVCYMSFAVFFYNKKNHLLRMLEMMVFSTCFL